MSYIISIDRFWCQSNNILHTAYIISIDRFWCQSNNILHTAYIISIDRFWCQSNNILHTAYIISIDRFWCQSNNILHTAYRKRAFSAVETRNVKRYLLNVVENPYIYISLHSYGQLILLPWGYTFKLADNYEDSVSHK